jgi:AraC-like DNA-binding protein
VGEHEQFAYWREVVCAAFYPLTPERDGEGAFAGTVHTWRLGPLVVSHVASQAQRVRRTPSLIDLGAADTYAVNLQLTGTGRAAQGAREAEQAPGDFVALDATRPFEISFPGAFRQLNVNLPLELLAPRLAAPDRATAVRVGSDSAAGAVAASLLRSLPAAAAAGPDRAMARAIAEHVAQALALALGHAVPPVGTRRRALLLAAALDEVDRSLSDPRLSPADVAARLGISTRYLHDLFSDHGATFGRWLLQRRLDRCAQELADPALSRRTISEIALAHGFTDPSHFTRSFRARFGHPPSVHRAQAR